MTWETSEVTPIRVTISFKKASTKEGSEGFDIEVLEGANEEEAKRVMGIARNLRLEALEAISNDLAMQLEASINGGKS